MFFVLGETCEMVQRKELFFESRGHDIQGSELGLDRTTWTELGLEATSRMGRSYEDTQLQFGKSKFRNTKLISSADF